MEGKLMTMALEDIQMTPRRVEMLQKVADDQVQYDTGTATYLVKDAKGAWQPARNWDFRTISELRQAELVRPTHVRGLTAVRPTREGQKALRSAR